MYDRLLGVLILEFETEFWIDVLFELMECMSEKVLENLYIENKGELGVGINLLAI